MKRSNVENPDLNTVGGRISKARMDKGLSIQELADKINKNYTFIRQYEMGIRNPKKDMIELISSALGVDPTWIEKGDFLFTDNEHGVSAYCFISRNAANKIQEDRNLNLNPDGSPEFQSDYTYNSIMDNAKLLRESGDDDLLKLVDTIIKNVAKARGRSFEQIWNNDIKNTI